MRLLDFFRRTEQKSYSSPELLLSYYGKTPQFNSWDATKAIKEGFKHSTWVYSCVNLRASSAAAVPWIVERKIEDGWEKVEGTPVNALLEKPNPDMDWPTMIQYCVQHLDLSGNAYWSKVRAGNMVAELWPLMPDALRVVPGSTRLVERYEYNLGVARRDIPPEDMIHFKYPDPGNLWFGCSPLHSAAQAVDIDNESERFQKVSLENRGLSDIHFEIPPEATAEQVRQLRDIYAEQQAGPRNARKALFSSAKATMLNTTAAELDFVESRRFIRDEICSAFGVPPPMVGNYEKATLANIETARQIFWRDTMIPVLDKLSGILNLQLVAEYGSELRIRYDLSQVDALQENYTEKVNNARGLWSMGLPWNEINRRLEMGFEDIEGGDVGYLPAGLLPSTFDESMPTDTQQPTTEAVPVVPGVAPVSSIQETALNGAQVASLLEIINLVATGQLPEATARGVIAASFPTLSEADISAMLSSLRGFTPETITDEQLKSLNIRLKKKDWSDLTAYKMAYGQKQDNIPPQGARAEAERGLEWRKEYNRGGTEVGVARARDIANGANLSDDTIGRMVSYFARHEVDKQGEGWSPGEDGYPSAGRIAWALWGGDPGRTWAESRLRQIQGD